jgi:ABC-type transporter Mla MlaB component
LLRISVQKRYGSIILTLEGKLIGPWVGELERAWRSTGAREDVWVDLCQVSFVDASGKDLLAQMWHEGAQFVADSPLMKQVVEEVTGSPEGCRTANATVQREHFPKGEHL